ncbi:MAG: hypothetical protein ABSH28_14495 [Acidobacteriota bacterium]
MSLSRGLPLCLCLARFLASSSYGQTVAPVGDPARELKRTAYRLHISADRLKNAREALRQATDLARHSKDSRAFDQIGQDWVLIDKDKATDALEDLYGSLKTTARNAPDVGTYAQCQRAASFMLLELAALDSGKAQNLWRMWPDSPAALGASASNIREQLSDQFEKALTTRMSSPGMIYREDLTTLSQQAAKGDYIAAGALVMQLYQTGNRAEALKVVDQATANFRQGSRYPQAISNYFQFVRNLRWVDSGTYLVALHALLAALNNDANPGAGGTLTVGNQTIQLTADV